MFIIGMILLIILPVLVIVAGLHDVVTMKIPNWLTISLFVAFYPCALILGMPLEQIGLATLVALGVLVAGMAMFALRWMGGGDAKLFAAVALWMGTVGVLPFMLLSAIAGGLFCLLLMSSRFWFQAYALNLPGWGQRLMQPKGDIPYGVAIAAGALWAYPFSAIVQHFSIV